MAKSNRSALDRQAKLIYKQRLKVRLESINTDDFVAIEPQSGDYLLAKTLSEAIQAARAAHPNRLPVALRVGHKATVEIGGIWHDCLLNRGYNPDSIVFHSLDRSA